MSQRPRPFDINDDDHDDDHDHDHQASTTTPSSPAAANGPRRFDDGGNEAGKPVRVRTTSQHSSNRDSTRRRTTTTDQAREKRRRAGEVVLPPPGSQVRLLSLFPATFADRGTRTRTRTTVTRTTRTATATTMRTATRTATRRTTTRTTRRTTSTTRTTTVLVLLCRRRHPRDEDVDDGTRHSHVESRTSSPGCDNVNGGSGPMARPFRCRRRSRGAVVPRHRDRTATSVDVRPAFAMWTPGRVLAPCQTRPMLHGVRWTHGWTHGYPRPGPFPCGFARCRYGSGFRDPRVTRDQP